MNRIISNLIKYFNLFIRFGGNRNEFFRWQGAKIGDNCNLQILSLGSEPWLIEIGNDVTIVSGSHLITHDGSSRLFRNSIPGSSKYGNRFGTIIIYENCFIGADVIILPDIKIGPNSIVGAGSVVTKDIPPNSVYAGVPATFICDLNEYIEKYNEKKIPIKSVSRDDLRKELTIYFWGEER